MDSVEKACTASDMACVLADDKVQEVHLEA